MKQKVCKDWRGWDKVFHISVCLVIGLVCAGVFSFIPFSSWWACFFTFMIVMAIGIGKEVRDSRQQGNHFCVWDLLADCISAVASAVVAYFANYFAKVLA